MAAGLPDMPPAFSREDLGGTLYRVCGYEQRLWEELGHLLTQWQKCSDRQQGDLVEARERLGAADKDRADLEARLAALEGQKAALETRLAEAESALEGVSGRVSVLETWKEESGSGS